MDAEQAGVLRDLLAVLLPLGLNPVLIGAAASGCLAGREPSLPRQRSTRDLDFALRLTDWSAWETLQAALSSAGFDRDPGCEHRFTRRDIPVDLVPFGPVAGSDPPCIRWPKADLVMQVTGFEEAAREARVQEAAPGIEVACITVPGFVLLKAAAYLDRAAKGDLKHRSDAEDLLYWLEHYASDSRDPRHFELPAAPPDLGLDHLAAGAAVLGRELSPILSPGSRIMLENWIAHALPAESRFWNFLYRPALDSDEIERRIDSGIRLVKSLQWGLSS